MEEKLMIASVVSEQGEKILSNCGFSMIKDYSSTEHYKLFYKGGEEI